jgi:hypothetical protein
MLVSSNRDTAEWLAMLDDALLAVKLITRAAARSMSSQSTSRSIQGTLRVGRCGTHYIVDEGRFFAPCDAFRP